MPLHEIEPSNLPSSIQEQESGFDSRVSRRGFLKIFGTAAAGVGAMSLVGCGGDDDTNSNIAEADSTPLDKPTTNAAEHEFEIGEAIIPLEKLPDDKSELRLENSIPQKFLLHVGTDISVMGVILGEGVVNKVVLSVSDKNSVDKDGKPKTFVCILPDKITPEEVQAGSVSFEELMKMNGASYELADGKAQLSIQETKQKGILPQLAKDQIDQEQKNAGVFFVPYNPLRPEQESLENPVVPVPEASLLSEGSTITQEADGRVVLKNTNGESTARARYYPWKKEWKWVKDPESVTDYTIREYADAQGRVFGLFDHDLRAGTGRTTDPVAISLVEKMGNQLITGSVDIKTVFRGYTQADWQKIVTEWPAVQEAFSNGKVPPGFRYNWADSDRMVDFAIREGMTIRAQHGIWGKDIPDSLRNGNFSNPDLEKILEFLIKSRGAKYKGKIQEWDVVDEPSADISFGGKNSWWYDKFGETVIDKAAHWFNEIDPEATLVLVDDHVIENNTNNFRTLNAKFKQLIPRLANARVPIKKIGIEQNLWIYSGVTKQQIKNMLQFCKDNGFGIASAEATVGSGPEDGFWKDLKTTTPVSNPQELQAKVYADLFSAYQEMDADFGLGGLSDATVWTADKYPQGKTMLFDEKQQPKPAYFAVLAEIKKKTFS